MRMTAFEAPEGYVYDYAEPVYDTIITSDGEERVEKHMYVKYLYLGKFDDIENYKLVKVEK